MASSNPRRVDFPEGIPVALRFFLVSGKGKILNLSSTGAYIATSMYLLPQAGVRLKIILREEKRWFETDAVVVWENRGTVGRRDGLAPGYGFRFVDPGPDAQRAIEKLIAGEAAARPVKDVDEIESEPEPRSVVHDDEPQGPPFRLRKDVVKKKTPARVSGIFVLSYDRTQEARVGRADEDLRATLGAFEGEYAYFYFEAIGPSDERYFRECELYHRLGGDRGQLDNTSHPVPPTGLDVDCPVCVAAKLTR
jgi:hypothetical protein